RIADCGLWEWIGLRIAEPLPQSAVNPQSPFRNQSAIRDPQFAMPDFSVIPSIDALRQRPAVRALEARLGADATLDALRTAGASGRGAMARGDDAIATADAATARIEDDAAAALHDTFRPSLQPVINATGVVIHTNLGRAPLADAAIDRVAAV